MIELVQHQLVKYNQFHLVEWKTFYYIMSNVGWKYNKSKYLCESQLMKKRCQNDEKKSKKLLKKWEF